VTIAAPWSASAHPVALPDLTDFTTYPPVEPAVVVAGSRAGAVHGVVTALLYGRHRLPYTPRNTYLLVRRGESRYDSSLMPEGAGPAARRVELCLPDPLLNHVCLIAVRAVPAAEATDRARVSELVQRCAALILVTDGGAPVQPAELDLLRVAAARQRPCFLVVAHADPDSWADVVKANQQILARRMPQLAFERWYVLRSRRSAITDLRRAMIAWAGTPRAAGVASRLIRVGPDAATSGWAQLLDAEVAHARDWLQRDAEHRLAQLRAGWPDRTALAGTDPGATLVALLDRQLQAFSVALADRLREAVDAILAAVLPLVLADPPDPGRHARIRAALRREIADAESDESDCYRAMLVTSAATAMVVTVPRQLTGMAAHGYRIAEAILPPLGVGLTSSCVSPGYDHVAGLADAQWVRQAIDAIEVELCRELDRQLGQFAAVVSALVTAGIEHGTLLV
jgi:hypothetical protein